MAPPPQTAAIQKGGHSSVISFNTLAQHQFPGDTASQIGFINDLTAMATHRDVLVSFESYSYRSGIGVDDDGVVEPGCALIPCRREIDPADPTNQYWVSTLTPDWLNSVPPALPNPDSYPGFSAEIVAYDKARWQQERDRACGRSERNALKLWGSVIGTGSSCLLAETILGAAGCAAGLGLVATTAGDGADDEAMCNKPYPGPGKW